jgi:Protein of unknown function (DUF642)
MPEKRATVHVGCPRFAVSPLAARLLVVSVLILSLVGLSRPTGAATPNNLIVNGSFEDPPQLGSEVVIYAAIPGWSESTGCGVEIWSNGFIRPADDGAQLVELDAFCNSRLEQTVPTTAGTTYLLSYGFSARPGTPESTNAVDVFVNGVLVDSRPSANTTSWDHYAVLFTADGPGTIAFAGAGDDDSLGSLLDNVSLLTVATGKAQCEEDGWESVVRADGTTFKNQEDCVSYTNTAR